MNTIILSKSIQQIRERCIHPTNPHDAVCGDFNNWINRQVICGPYPGVDGKNYLTEESAVINLKHLIDNGVSVFVSLQAETTAHTFNDPGSVDPRFKWAFPEYISYAYLIAKYGLDVKGNIIFLSFPINDCTVPTHKEFINNMIVLLEHLQSSKTIFIHCAGGHGRTGLYVACLLLTLNHISHAEALKLTQQLHDVRQIMDRRQYLTTVSSPSTQAQIKFVQHYKQFLSFFTRIE